MIVSWRAGRSISWTLAIVLGILFGGCSGSSEPSEDRPPVILVSIDTLRSDRLPVYGYRDVATPAIDRLARDGMVFERAYSQSPSTLPSHASLFTGLLPPDHRVRGNTGYRLESVDLPYLPRRLRDAGYATAAAVSSFVMRREAGLGEGFDLYEDAIDYRANIGAEGLQRAGAKTLTAILPWLRSVGNRPFFLFLHLYEPHSPYAPPEPFRSRYASPYDGEVAAADAVVDSLLHELGRLNLYDRSLVVLVSDHGEGLGDHGEDEHGIFVYRESIQVPLIIKLPEGARAGTRIGSPVGLFDVFPTLLDALGLEREPELPGISLLESTARAGGQRAIYAETYFPRFYLGWSELSTIVLGRHQYIESASPELFDLLDDPAQRVNLIEQSPEIATPLRERLSRIDRRLVTPHSTDRETWERLAALGYVGHAQIRAPVELPAPWTQVAVLDLLEAGFQAALAGDHLAAIATMQQVVADNPYALVAWEQLGRSYEAVDRHPEALAAWRRALELSENEPHLLLAAARMAARSGELAEARTLAETAQEWDPAGAGQILAEVAIAEGDLSRAERHARASLQLRPNNLGALFALAQIELAQRDPESALDLIEQAAAETRDAPWPRLQLLRGNILASLERWDEAEAAWRNEIAQFPTNAPAYTRLAVYLARHQRADEAVEVVRDLVERNPTPMGYARAVELLKLLGDEAAAASLLAHAHQRFPDSDVLPPGP